MIPSGIAKELTSMMQTWLMNEAVCPPVVRQEPDMLRLKSEVITILGANSNSDKNIAGMIHAKVILTHTRKGKLNIL